MYMYCQIRHLFLNSTHTFGMSFGPDAQRDVLVQDGLEVTAEAMELGVDVDGEGARVEAVAVDVSGERMLEGEELLRLRQLCLVLETHHVGRLEVALGMFVRVAARADLVVEFRRLKRTDLERGEISKCSQIRLMDHRIIVQLD